MSLLDTKNLMQGISLDCVIFGFHNNDLRVLLLELKNIKLCALPGGFIANDEDVDLAASRVLQNRTGMTDIFLQQFYLFGKVSRNVPGHADRLVREKLIGKDLYSFFNRRYVTIGYYALVEYTKVNPLPDEISVKCDWYNINDLPGLILDHREIILQAHETLKSHLNFKPIGIKLLPAKFTLRDIQSLYETILSKKLDRRNFRRKILGFNILNALQERRTGLAQRPAQLYKFNLSQYNRALHEGLNQGW